MPVEPLPREVDNCNRDTSNTFLTHSPLVDSYLAQIVIILLLLSLLNYIFFNKINQQTNKLMICREGVGSGFGRWFGGCLTNDICRWEPDGKGNVNVEARCILLPGGEGCVLWCCCNLGRQCNILVYRQFIMLGELVFSLLWDQSCNKLYWI